ncbi:hypothetical protein QCA50_016936 [Cerrena zonata]|uniref:Uncharacterized protein n=1 Tax=Cerrena zonata TaxID=2478898 RepID=A0AAW0FTH1_9APHY
MVALVWSASYGFTPSIRYQFSPNGHNTLPLVYICVTQSFQWVPSEIVILDPLPLPSIMYFSLTLLLHVTLTGLIILRLWKCETELRAVLGDGHGKHYNAISAVFAESAFMNVGCSTLLLASSLSEPSQTSAMNLNSTFQIWMAITPAVQACANYLIVYRGARGFYGSWSNNVSIPKVSTDVFASSEALANEYDGPDHTIRSRRTSDDSESSIV